MCARVCLWVQIMMCVLPLSLLYGIEHGTKGVPYSQLTMYQIIFSMMTSSNGMIFRVTGPLCGEFTGHRWIPRTKGSDAELWCFLWSTSDINGWVNNCEAGDLKRHHAHYDVTEMHIQLLKLWNICVLSTNDDIVLSTVNHFRKKNEMCACALSKQK